MCEDVEQVAVEVSGRLRWDCAEAVGFHLALGEARGIGWRVNRI